MMKNSNINDNNNNQTEKNNKTKIITKKQLNHKWAKTC